MTANDPPVAAAPSGGARGTSDEGVPGGREKVEAVRAGLLAWFAANARDLPWRRTRDPYRVLVSEIMLQQTQVDRVIPLYEAFLARFPTLEALAEAPAADVIRQWAGLGYNRRAVNLQRTAQYVTRELGGIFPTEPEALQALPGIGPYTAGAVAAFAFERDAAFVDTNMRRVVHRLFFGPDVPAPTAGEREVLRVAAALVPPGQGWAWNQGLIEFGALQCTARKPACVICPVQRVCLAYPAVQTALAELPKGTRLKREAVFEGSNRMYRGRVVAALRARVAEPDGTGEASPGLDLRSLGPLVRDGFTDEDLPWLYGVVEGLSRDGLAAIAEDPSPYDAAGEEAVGDPGAVRVTLP